MSQTLIGSRVKEDLPKLEIKWLRKRDKLNWLKTYILLVLGYRGSGKSALLENCALRHHKIVDLFGSRDNESLAWCRDSSPVDDILLVHGNNVDLSCSWDAVPVKKCSYKKMLGYEVVVTADSFFSSVNDKYFSMKGVIEQFWNRYTWKRPIFVIVREASSFLYSRIRLEHVTMKVAKADFIYFQREMRHFGYSLGIDTIRWTSIDKEMRDLSDYLVLKAVGINGIPADLKWLYRYFRTMEVQDLAPHRFIMVARNGAIGYGRNELPKFHKEEGIDLVKELGINIDVGDEQVISTSQRVGDEEHANIIKLYHDEDISMGIIAKKLTRSSYTIRKHIEDHDEGIEANQVCELCARVRSRLKETKVRKTRRP